MSTFIKEILRIYLPDATAGFSNPNNGLNVRLPNGQDMCLDRLVFYSCQGITQRNQAVYSDKSNQFFPQR
ncbi:hypothetical protein PITC_097640 [Penicillium italicum]|uniref:Uncharacterized protein n=1 Tax=Penicillium italicum TaxID=40296 RepID=A0A0A2L4H3_PENIT|nr:hypothetical protein PITC_097640 [Penicillium italicum]